MDLHTAVERVLEEFRQCSEPEGEPVHAAFDLALHIWRSCDKPDHGRARWDMFGTGVHAALGELLPPQTATIIVLDEEHLRDTPALRRDAARLANAIAAHLDAAAGDPLADPARRWAWSIAAARIRGAAYDLAAPA